MRNLFSLACLLGTCSLFANDSIQIRESQIPLLIDRTDNVLFRIRVDNHSKELSELNSLQLQFDKKVKMKDVQAVKLFYAGTEAMSNNAQLRFSPTDYLSRDTPRNTRIANRTYSVLKDSIANPGKKIILEGNQKLFPGVNYFWVSLQMKPNAELTQVINSEVTGITIDGKNKPFFYNQKQTDRRLGVGVRHAGDDQAAAFRIPGFVTSNAGTLLGVYDVRYNSSVDLQEHIDIGLSRSTDKGQTWEPMRIIMDMGEYNGLPEAQNGVGDPAILVDEKTGTIWVIAAWTHGEGNARSWWNSNQGMSPEETAQLLLVRSDDDGKTWSKPINITSQVKDPSWYFLLQGPGRGISMKNGNLVFPIQYIDSTRVPNAGIMYSEDHGENWKIHELARTNTTEAQVAETEPGVLMLNMRDNRGGSRAVSTTTDYGKTWSEHPSSRSALQEPVCMASLIHVDAKENVLGKDLLIFSNPNSTKHRKDMTIKISEDGGLTWPYELLIDEGYSWGYSCLSMVDKETVGIFYEGSPSHMTYQSVKLKDIVKK